MLRMIYEFMKVGFFSVGGGLATLPFLAKLGEATGWFTAADLADMIAVSESTPGPIGVNMSTMVGARAYGIPGGIAATLALVFPSVVIILIIAHMMEAFQESKLVKSMFFHLRPAATGLILAAVQSVLVITLLDVPAYTATGEPASLFRVLPIVLFAIFFILIQKWNKIHPIVFLIAGGVLGVVFGL